MAYTVPDLPYDYNALEPYIDEETMHLHHDKHHQAYVTNANKALEGTEWADKPVEEVLENLSSLPEDKRGPVRNNAGGHYNHSLFWEWMSPDGGGEPDGALRAAIDAAFGSFDDFKAQAEGRGRRPLRLGLGVARARRLGPGDRLDARIRTARSQTARRRCSASTSGSTPTTSSTRTGARTTSTRGGTSSTGRRSPRSSQPSANRDGSWALLELVEQRPRFAQAVEVAFGVVDLPRLARLRDRVLGPLAG